MFNYLSSNFNRTEKTLNGLRSSLNLQKRNLSTFTKDRQNVRFTHQLKYKNEVNQFY